MPQKEVENTKLSPKKAFKQDKEEQDEEKLQSVEENQFEREETKNPFKFLGGLLKAAVEKQQKDSLSVQSSGRQEPSIHITQYNEEFPSFFID